jgi:hypothetical protein
MTCTKPIEIDGQLSYPCGKCIACRIQRTQEWSIRLMHEDRYWPTSSFLTLTYDEDHLPAGDSLDKEEFKLWLKRFGKSLERPWKYYAVGEYGDDEQFTQRPHYHLIAFGVDREDFKKHPHIKEKHTHATWENGFIDVEMVNYSTIKYVCGYIQKKLYGQMAVEEYGEREHVFALMSNGLGKQYALDNAEKIQKDQCIYFKGREHGVPRAYVKWLNIELDAYSQKNAEETHAELLRRFKIQKTREDDLQSFRLKQMRQREINKEKSHKR